MRKRSKYRPRGVRLDSVSYVLSGLKKFDEVSTAIDLRIKNHAALEAVRKGDATKADIDVLIAAFNMAEAFTRLRDDLGADWAAEIREAQDALLELARRGVDQDHFVCKGPELMALNLAMQVHDAQLDSATVLEVEKGVDLVNKEYRTGKARQIIKPKETA